jgi:hydroxypyruvate reductase
MHPACFASIASDGTDGPTDSAGGLVDPGTVRRAADLGLDALRSLEANDSYSLLEAVGDSVRTGPTGTNLMDLQILLVG